LSITSNITAEPPNMTHPILLQDISVRYKLPKERIRTFKEFAIRVIQRRFEYEEFWALKNINFHVARGEMLGIVGRNGAGKSTLLKVIAGVMKPIRGQVWVDGRVAPLIELGTGFDTELTGRENIYLNGSILGITRKMMNGKFEEIVEFSELRDFIEAPLRAYSSGMVARLGFAIATAVDPQILILDEILSVGDESFQRKCLERINRFRQAGTTILFVSHNLEQIQTMCDLALWLEQGEIRGWGDTRQVVQQYVSFLNHPILAPEEGENTGDASGTPQYS